MQSIVCFCFNYTKEDIIQDIITNQRSTILSEIQEAKKSKRCDCVKKNPSGK